MSEPLRIIELRNRSLWVEGGLHLPRSADGLKAAFTLDDLLGDGDKRSVIYGSDPVAQVADAELEDDEEAWILGELDKRNRWLDKLRYFAERKGLNLRGLFEQLQPGGLRAVEIAHRPTYTVSPSEVRGTLSSLGIPVSPALKAALEQEEIAEVVERLQKMGYA
jgi:hypothetical protein